MDKATAKIIVILGPTASGKSAVAIKLAQDLGGEIISADSRQIYRGMNIGTGKVTKREQQQAQHWMLDIASPRTNYNAAKFKKAAEKIIGDILKRGKVPIICGGTGFWIKAIVDDVTFPEVKPDWKLRKRLGEKSASALALDLKKLDPKRYSGIDRKNKVRLIRAIEICRSVGKVPCSTSPIRENRQWAFLQIGIAMPKKTVDRRIKNRLEQRFEQGMIREVHNLHFKKKVSWKRLEKFGLEYYWVAQYLQGRIPIRIMKEKLYIDIVHYAKRQMTWFQKDGRIFWERNIRSIHARSRQFVQKK